MGTEQMGEGLGGQEERKLHLGYKINKYNLKNTRHQHSLVTANKILKEKLLATYF